MKTRSKKAAYGIAVVVSSLVLAACGSGSDGSSGDGAAEADTEAAEALIAPYTGQPSKFPITEPLATKPTGKRIAYLDCGTPICGLFYTLGKPPMEALGMSLTSIKSGLQADTVQAAFDTVIQDGYDGVFVPAIPPALWERGLEQLQAAEIPVVTSGAVGLDPTAVPVQQAGTQDSTRAGQVLAGQVVSETGGESDVAIYYTPELDFTNLIKDSFVAEMKKLCPDCAVRPVKVPVSTFGTTSQTVIVDDLQAKPDTKTAVFAVGEQAAGLPAALKTAGIEIETIVNSPDPANLEAIQKGDLTLGFGLDLPVIAWTAADSLARLTTGQPVDPGATQDIAPRQMLKAADLQGDMSHGWTGYPDFADKFMALWAGAK
jgi:ribose transport system substrate-binding protein